MASLVNSTNILKRINANSSQTLPNKSEEEGTHPNSFYEANITLKEKPEKHATKKKNYLWQYRCKNHLLKKTAN